MDLITLQGVEAALRAIPARLAVVSLAGRALANHVAELFGRDLTVCGDSSIFARDDLCGVYGAADDVGWPFLALGLCRDGRPPTGFDGGPKIKSSQRQITDFYRGSPLIVKAFALPCQGRMSKFFAKSVP